MIVYELYKYDDVHSGSSKYDLGLYDGLVSATIKLRSVHKDPEIRFIPSSTKVNTYKTVPFSSFELKAKYIITKEDLNHE